MILDGPPSVLVSAEVSPYTLRVRRLSVSFTLLLAAQAAAQQKATAPGEFVSWLPITDNERSLKLPVVEKDAGAEILLWRVHVADELLGDNREFQRGAARPAMD